MKFNWIAPRQKMSKCGNYKILHIKRGHRRLFYRPEVKICGQWKELGKYYDEEEAHFVCKEHESRGSTVNSY